MNLPDPICLVRNDIQADDVDVEGQVPLVIRDASGTIRLSLKAGEGAHQLSGSHLLLAIGSAPNTESLNLSAAGIEADKHGYILVNERLETGQSGIYALGDVKGGPAFTHISYDDYRIVKQNLLEGDHATSVGRPVPYCIFTDPQLGRIGLSEREAHQQGRRVKLFTMPMTSVARAIETSQTNGLMKVVVEAGTEQVLGAAVLGMEGGELMAMLQIAMMGNVPYTRLKEAVFAHPTLAESFNNLFRQPD